MYRLLNYIIREGRLEAKGALCDRKQGRRAIRSAESGHGINAHLFIAKVLDRLLQSVWLFHIHFHARCIARTSNITTNTTSRMTRQITSAKSNAVGGALSDSSFMQPMYLKCTWLVYYCRHKLNDLNSLPG